MTQKVKIEPFGSQVEFAQFGKNAIAYVREVTSDDLNQRFPQGPALPEGVDLWGLFTADGQPIAVAEEPMALVQNADEMELMAVQRH